MNSNHSPRRRTTLLAAVGLFLIPVATTTRAETPANTDTPKAAAKAFYDIVIKRQVRGLPHKEAWTELQPRLSPKLISLVEAARAEQAAFMKKQTDEKPPWIDGDLFTSLFEGPQTHSEGEARVSADQAKVSVSFTYTEGGSTTKWTDTLILTKGPAGNWLVDDVFYGGGWDFASEGKLSESLKVRE
ncbi:hypothetical protein DES53_113165 [Roseimicrobium gellanilyticum]|uniref:DUF3828 domain-containing protein n=1 Tax=Roseimicrobium gellanilyticum TaxID=748857 RepID=A0A366H8G2_9BACT|nr:hypothetical protein [Roseimicrobium gellanilyticum]RBP37782.1 hypothetical protein DES53_113165 [Roseimicrobium gellanilyticum]